MQWAYWSESAMVKYRVGRRRQVYLVDRLEKKRRVVTDPVSGGRKLAVRFECQRRFKVFPDPLICDTRVCPEFYFLGRCQHTQIIQVLHETWDAMQQVRLEKLCQQLMAVRDVLISALGTLENLAATLEAVKSARLIQGLYVIFTVDFLKRLPLRALVRILEAIRFPLASIAHQPLESVLRQVCRFHQQQWANRPMLLR